MKDDKFRKLIQNIGLDEPSPSLDDNIMKIIETKEKVSLNPAFLSVIKNELLAEPSLEFSDILMDKIKPKGSKSIEPIITIKTALIILSFFILIVLLAMINSRLSLHHIQNASYFSHFSLNLSGAIMRIIKISTTVLPYLITISSLLLMDYFFRTKQSRLDSGG